MRKTGLVLVAGAVLASLVGACGGGGGNQKASLSGSSGVSRSCSSKPMRDESA